MSTNKNKTTSANLDLDSTTTVTSKRGGKRQGAGRPKGTGKYGEPTQAIRIPKSLIPNIKEWLAIRKSQETMQDVAPVVQLFAGQSQLKQDVKHCRLPIYSTKIAAGFPSPADDHLEGKIDLNEHLIQHPAATFYVKVSGESMLGAGIHPNDLLIVDRSLEPTDGKIVIAVLNGELTVKRLSTKNNKVQLLPENPNFQPIDVGEECEFKVWGVVTKVIHSL